jgi:uncharacterized protein (TIGR03435 family)
VTGSNLKSRYERIRKKTFLASAFASVATPVILAILNLHSMRAQDAPDWQTRAGGKLAFEVASVKLSKGAVVPSNVPLNPWDESGETQGSFRADATLSTYVQFAYKLWPSEVQSREFSRLPKWVASDRYSVEARPATGSPTNDQMRLMVQSLLAERFQLAAHFETREVPVFELMVAKPGKLGPKLVPHAGEPPCDQPGPSPGDGLPGFNCHSFMAFDKPDMLILFGSRDITIDGLAAALSILSSVLGRPVMNKTGLNGRFDSTLEWAREPRGPAASASPAPVTPAGPTLIEALRDQLGLKLEPAKAALQILVIDRVERPSEN